ncbi:hypothetical protein TWF694_004046 [Orbilia ellipsospora]|uniref:UbiA prenyltransferase n=1 Tax=Orbilia ellipsospora TaxID=2528407 RepID=A0AAV9WXQ6_9PEZI
MGFRNRNLCLLWCLVYREIRITWRLLHANLGVNVPFFLIQVFARYLAVSVSQDKLVSAVLNALVIIFVCAYVFDIVNQIWSAEEDKLNKPYRPIPSGLLTVREAGWRWFLSWMIGPLVLCWFYGATAMIWLCIWQSWVFFCYVWPKYDHWLLKNLFTTFGALQWFRLFNIVLSDIAPEWDMPFMADLIAVMWAMGTIHIQDFSEVKGDRASNRKTLPIILSEDKMFYVRVATAVYMIGYCVCAFLWGYFYFQSSPRLTTAIATGIGHFMGSLLLVFGVLFGRGQRMDKYTYYIGYPIGQTGVIIHITCLTLTRRGL